MVRLMKLPNRVISIEDSILYKLPSVLSEIKNGDVDVKRLSKNKKLNISVDELLDILDVLFILEKIKQDEKGNLEYVNKNSVL